MKTLLLLASISLMIAGVTVLDSHRMDAAGWISALPAAALFAVAYRDRAPRRSDRVRGLGFRFRATRSAAWAEPKTCVLCPAASS